MSGVFPTTHCYSEGGTVIDTCVYSIVVALNNKNKKTNEELKEENNKKAWLSVLFETTIEECLRVQPELLDHNSTLGRRPITPHHFTITQANKTRATANQTFLNCGKYHI